MVTSFYLKTASAGIVVLELIRIKKLNKHLISYWPERSNS